VTVGRSHDVLVVGAGIVGAACALALRERGMDVALVDAASPGSGVTAAGMGHVVALDESAAELDLCLLSQGLWRDFFAAHPGVGEPQHCGTLWVAENEHQLIEAARRAERLAARGCAAEPLTASQLRKLEPALRRGLCGGVRVRGDSVVYPPAVADFLARRLVALGGTLRLGQRVQSIGRGEVTLANGDALGAAQVVLATGAQVRQLLPEVPVLGRKGHLAITDRYPGTLAHQVVSMDYGQAGAGDDALAVAANVQPRATGQWLVGSCRQDRQGDSAVDPQVLGKVLRSAIALLPCLAQMTIVRAWTGMRPASPDGLPLIGEHPGRPGVWLACGHEGLGVTTAFGSAALLADQLTGRASAIDGAAFAPARFAALERPLHA
jgi:glycine/D-amino acid oxidase-like deaminating enzyme